MQVANDSAHEDGDTVEARVNGGGQHVAKRRRTSVSSGDDDGKTPRLKLSEVMKHFSKRSTGAADDPPAEPAAARRGPRKWRVAKAVPAAPGSVHGARKRVRDDGALVVPLTQLDRHMARAGAGCGQRDKRRKLRR